MTLGAAIAKFTSRGPPHPVEGPRRINKRQGLLFEEPEAVTAIVWQLLSVARQNARPPFGLSHLGLLQL